MGWGEKAIAAAAMRDGEKTMRAMQQIAENTRGSLAMDRELELLRKIEVLTIDRERLRTALKMIMVDGQRGRGLAIRLADTARAALGDQQIKSEAGK